jgi:hypothetical protein
LVQGKSVTALHNHEDEFLADCYAGADMQEERTMAPIEPESQLVTLVQQVARLRTRVENGDLSATPWWD